MVRRSLAVGNTSTVRLHLLHDTLHFISMIKSFRHKGLKELFVTGRSAKVAPSLQERSIRRLDALHQANIPEDMNIPGFDFHSLRRKPTRYTVHVNGPWCITFGFEKGHALLVDLEQYH